VANVVSCPSCGAIVVPLESGNTCPHCQRSLEADLDPSADVTRLAEPAVAAPRAQQTPPVGVRSDDGRRRTHGTATSSGWLSSSGSIDHGRFAPGTLLGGRYRVVGRLGRGGMGEVFRADDLKLGQPVALKFLPSEVDRDPALLTQLHTEVRMARQVSHPNVCRVYDIDEVDGHTFLSMEYVDGEDLASLLRRIGRFPEDRGLEIARQICAGLAAAHERGIVHRDFKPANVMLDGAGKVRITDFGLAGVSGESIRAGTPAYMAPEQLAGAEVTPRSDIYALGLVLYEIFTGQRALEGKNLAELIHKREQFEIVPPSAIVQGLDQRIEESILRCLRPEITARPPSALAVAAALPGGDPLAAALAAGETPSPEMVAAAGASETISLRTAVLAATWIAISLMAIVVLYQRVMLVNRVSTLKSPEALFDRAQEALVRLGYADEAAAAAAGSSTTARGLSFSLDYARFIATNVQERDRWQKLRAGRPETLVAWYRTSPRPLQPYGLENNIEASNPPLTVGGMTTIVVDASGRLGEFIAVPYPRSKNDDSQTAGAEPDWSVLFAAAGLPLDEFTEVAPTRVGPVFADRTRAWQARLPEQPEHPFTVEAGAHRGRPVYFVVAGPWSVSARETPASPSRFTAIVAALGTLVVPALMVAGAVLARRNLRLGRGDRAGAFRAASVLFVVVLASWFLSASHFGVTDFEIRRIYSAIGGSLFQAGLLWVTYLGLEPYVRRVAPDSLIGWTRLLGGRIRDARVAIDVLIGISAGLAMTLFYAVHNVLPPLFGAPEPQPLASSARILLGGRFVLGSIAGGIGSSITTAMLAVVGLVALLMLLKNRWLAAAVGAVIYTPVVIDGMFSPGTPLLDLAIGAGIISILIGVILRVGLLATVAAMATHFVLLRAPLTTELSSWRGPAALWYIAVVAGAGLAACYVARTGGPAPSSATRSPLDA
jgi:serine/threonine-protein kinase